MDIAIDDLDPGARPTQYPTTHVSSGLPCRGDTLIELGLGTGQILSGQRSRCLDQVFQIRDELV
jgi:hypothetical protein